MAYPEPLMRHEADFLKDLDKRLWVRDLFQHRTKPNGFISQHEFHRVIAIMADSRLGLALHTVNCGRSIIAKFFPDKRPQWPKKGAGGSRSAKASPEPILILSDTHFGGPEQIDEALAIVRRNEFLERLYPFTRTPVNLFFYKKIGIGGVHDPSELFLTEELEPPPINALSMSELGRLQELKDRLWRTVSEYGDTPRTQYTQVPTSKPLALLTDADRTIINELIDQEKVFVTASERYAQIFFVPKPVGISISVYAPPWHRLTKASKSLLFTIDDRHFSVPEDAEYGARNALCLESFKSLILSPSNVAALERYSDGIPKMFKET